MQIAFGSKAPFLEDFKLYAPAGFLTCPRFELPSQKNYLSVTIGSPKRCKGLTVAGLFRIST